MKENKEKITCLTFQKQESLIKDIINKTNQAKGVLEKARFAKELQREVEVLLSCPDYNGRGLECKNCHLIASLRKKTVNLIIKAKKLV